MSLHCDSACSVHCDLFGVSKSLQLSLFPELPNNDAPSPHEIATIAGAVQKAKVDLVRLEAAITKRRVELGEFIQRHAPVLSAIRQLPNEILSAIFSECVDINAPFDPLKNGPWVVFQVCRRWRAVAILSSELWCHFVLADAPFPANHQTLLRMLRLQLDRARLARLSIQFPASEQRDVVDIFLAVPAQWHDVSIYDEDTLVHIADATYDGVGFPLLKKLTLARSALRVSGDLDILEESFPALTHLVLGLGEANSFPHQLFLPWSQLQRCDFHKFWTSDVLSILPFFSSNAHVSICGCLDDDASTEDTTPAVSKIGSLEIDAESLRESYILSRVVAQALQMLTIDNVDDIHYPFSRISQATLDCASSLKHLRIQNPSNDISSWSRFVLDVLGLPLTQNIHRLDVDYLEDLDAFVEVLGCTARLLPHLRTLCVRRPLEDVSDSTLLHVLAHRNPIVHRVELLGLDQWEFPENWWSGGLDIIILQQEGVNNTT